ncbi:YcgL domain-containing protein [Marinimicrobium sp. ARAG 43.8]|uniref:YcgL domain-containing protein n=1 Tax=Marinimicrobium sp. ARAG 43.8 TaxID=3418719 RepID=UPI003CF19D8D
MSETVTNAAGKAADKKAADEKVLCEIFRSPKEEGMYLYVRRDEGLARVPDALLQRFGKPQSAMVLVLTPDRKLARTSAERVMASLDDPGYYLQLPPGPQADREIDPIREHNSKLGH